MIFRHDTQSVTIILASSLSDVSRVAQVASVTAPVWQPIQGDSALQILSTLPDRDEALRALRRMFDDETGSLQSRRSDGDILRLAAGYFQNGRFCVITRAPAGGGRTGEDAEKSNYVTEAIEPEENPTGIPKKKEKDHWIIVELVGETGEPISNELCRLTLPDGQVVERKTDSQGRVEETGILKGDCVIEFPDLDKDAWEGLPANG